MKLTKGKISKLYSKKRQTKRHYKKNSKKEGKTFRKKGRLNLINRTLKRNMYGGVGPDQVSLATDPVTPGQMMNEPFASAPSAVSGDVPDADVAAEPPRISEEIPATAPASLEVATEIPDSPSDVASEEVVRETSPSDIASQDIVPASDPLEVPEPTNGVVAPIAQQQLLDTNSYQDQSANQGAPGYQEDDVNSDNSGDGDGVVQGEESYMGDDNDGDKLANALQTLGQFLASAIADRLQQINSSSSMDPMVSAASAQAQAENDNTTN